MVEPILDTKIVNGLFQNTNCLWTSPFICFRRLIKTFLKSRPAKPEEYKEFIDWFARQPHPYKVLISGNRDLLMDSSSMVRIDEAENPHI